MTAKPGQDMDRAYAAIEHDYCGAQDELEQELERCRALLWKLRVEIFDIATGDTLGKRARQRLRVLEDSIRVLLAPGKDSDGT